MLFHTFLYMLRKHVLLYVRMNYYLSSTVSQLNSPLCLPLVLTQLLQAQHTKDELLKDKTRQHLSRQTQETPREAPVFLHIRIIQSRSYSVVYCTCRLHIKYSSHKQEIRMDRSRARSPGVSFNIMSLLSASLG